MRVIVCPIKPLRPIGPVTFSGVTRVKSLRYLAASDALRPEVPAAIQALRSMGIQRIELLTGDNERTAAALALQLGVQYRANLLPLPDVGILANSSRWIRQK